MRAGIIASDQATVNQACRQQRQGRRSPCSCGSGFLTFQLFNY